MPKVLSFSRGFWGYEMAYAITNFKFDLKAPQQVVMLKMFIPGQRVIYKIHKNTRK